MIPSSAETPGWKPLRWTGVIFLVLSLQVLLIFWLSDRSPHPTRRPNPAPPLLLSRGFVESFPLEDPALFALPGTNGFSGPAWLEKIPVPRQPPDWAEQAAWLPLRPEHLGVAANFSAADQPLGPSLVVNRPRFETNIVAGSDEPLFPTASKFGVAGELAKRELLTPLELPSWPHPDLLSSTVLLMMVDTAGRPASVNLIAGSGLKAADDFALERARTLRFNRLNVQPGKATTSAATMQWGHLVFDWHVLPQSTNSLSQNR